MNIQNGFGTRLAKALAQTPDLPDCFAGIMRRIKRRRAVVRAVWGIAASLAISATAIVYHVNQTGPAVSPEVVEEIQNIRSQVSGEDIREEFVSCSLIGEYME